MKLICNKSLAILLICIVFITSTALMSMFQVWISLSVYGTYYNFDNYSIIEWVFQTIYWNLSLFISMIVAVIAAIKV